jgi:hypothetical protein
MHGRNHKQSQRTCGELHSVPPNAVSCAVEFLWLRYQSDVKRCEGERSEIGSRTEKTKVGSQRSEIIRKKPERWTGGYANCGKAPLAQPGRMPAI